ncbi:MAG: DNA repair protein RecO [Gammaproteobacteria bacterium]|nr:DNA repair protein RecO [Gammaproteobacteria bacterium]
MSARWLPLGIPVQIRVTDQPAYLLHRRDWRNTSLILDLMTLEYGRISLLAKGSKSGKSTGLYQPFCQLMVSWSGRQELKTLTAIDGKPIPINEQLYLPLLYVNELIAAFLPQQESSPELFAQYGELLENINLPDTEQCLRRFERSAMWILGYLPEMTLDAESGDPVQAQLYYHFLASRGFLRCDKAHGNAISGGLIIDWNHNRFDNSEVLQIAKTVMRCIIDFNLQGKRLKSRDIYLQINKWK